MANSTSKNSDCIKLLEECLAAWNTADAGKVASYYAESLDYRDPNVPQGIAKREDFVRYLRVLFRRWPSQEWKPVEVMPHENPGAFSVAYHYRYANKTREIKGWGMDRIEFEGDKIRLNHVYLNAEPGIAGG